MDFETYSGTGFYDEMVQADGTVRPHYRMIEDRFRRFTPEEYRHFHSTAERSLMISGITFQVYSESANTERIFPLDLIPRVMPRFEWDNIERGLIQRITALNLFIDDIYGEKRIIRDGLVPSEVVESSKGYLPQCEGIKPPRSVWNHVTGSDIVRDRDGTIYVLEDNLRCPSGVAYVLANREIMKRIFPRLFENMNIMPVRDYPTKLLDTLRSLAPDGDNVTVCVWTPGIYNSAYFEHSYLALQMGVDLVEGSDLIVQNDTVYLKTTSGLRKADVIYRRVDDTFMDPSVFRKDSLLGVPGLMAAYRKGNVAIANAPGTGVADDKVVYAYVPEMIKYYLSEEPILSNVPTYLCFRERDKRYVCDNLERLVVKSANEAGGYGMMIGPASTREERDEFRARIEKDPRNYIAQPTISLSTVPTFAGGSICPRHVDLRPYILYGEKIWVMPGGLTRVALKQGSLVVNSSQGGGSKDTWVVGEEGTC